MYGHLCHLFYLSNKRRKRIDIVSLVRPRAFLFAIKTVSSFLNETSSIIQSASRVSSSLYRWPISWWFLLQWLIIILHWRNHELRHILMDIRMMANYWNKEFPTKILMKAGIRIMKCLGKYKWIKLYRAALPQGKGIMVGSTCRQGCLSARKGPVLRAHKRCNTGNVIMRYCVSAWKVFGVLKDDPRLYRSWMNCRAWDIYLIIWRQVPKSWAMRSQIEFKSVRVPKQTVVRYMQQKDTALFVPPELLRTD